MWGEVSSEVCGGLRCDEQGGAGDFTGRTTRDTHVPVARSCVEGAGGSSCASGGTGGEGGESMVPAPTFRDVGGLVLCEPQGGA